MERQSAQDRARIRALLLQSRAGAGEHLAAIRSARPLDEETLRRELREYILCKYMLQGVDCGTDNFNALTELSLARSMKVSKDLVEEFDTAKSCDGATSAMAKKVLLMMNLEKELDIQIPAGPAAKDITLEELISLIWDTMARSPSWNGRLAAAEYRAQAGS